MQAINISCNKEFGHTRLHSLCKANIVPVFKQAFYLFTRVQKFMYTCELCVKCSSFIACMVHVHYYPYDHFPVTHQLQSIFLTLFTLNSQFFLFFIYSTTMVLPFCSHIALCFTSVTLSYISGPAAMCCYVASYLSHMVISTSCLVSKAKCRNSVGMKL